MRTRLCLLVVLVFSIGSFFVVPYSASAEDPTATATATQTPAPPRFFMPQVQAKALSTPVGPLQDVQGRVVAKNGAGVDGVRVRAAASGWQAFEVTRDGGRFKFSLTNGSYAIRLVDMVAGEAEFTVDGKSEVQVQFVEVDSLLLPATATPTVASPTATATATATPSPSATPFPTATPEPLVQNVDSVPAPEVTPVSNTSIFPFSIEVDPAPLLRVFLCGVGLGGALVFLGLLAALARRL